MLRLFSREVIRNKACSLSFTPSFQEAQQTAPGTITPIINRDLVFYTACIGYILPPVNYHMGLNELQNVCLSFPCTHAVQPKYL